MVPAMDRSSKSRARLIFIGLGLASGLVQAGCSQMKSKIWGESRPPAVLGRTMDTHDSYAQAHAPASAPEVVASTADHPVDEVGMALRPPESAPVGSGSPVELRPPAPIDRQAGTRPAQGVPDAARILASAGPRTSTTAGPDAAQVVEQARAALDRLKSYEVALHRQERVNGSLLPEEDVELAVRRRPRSIRLSWPDGPNRGREVLYSADQPGGKMHVRMANPALPRLAIDPRSPIVMRNSRHPVTEAGFDSLVEGLETALGEPVAYRPVSVGPEMAEGLDRPHLCLARTTSTGERWKVYLDPANHLPSLVVAVDARGELLERYRFRDFRPDLPELASGDAFDPTARWGPQRGLFGGLSRADRSDPSDSPR